MAYGFHYQKIYICKLFKHLEKLATFFLGEKKKNLLLEIAIYRKLMLN